MERAAPPKMKTSGFVWFQTCVALAIVCLTFVTCSNIQVSQISTSTIKIQRDKDRVEQWGDGDIYLTDEDRIEESGDDDYWITETPGLLQPSSGDQVSSSKEEKKESKSLRMVHVWSPYVVRTANDNPFAPLDQAQNVTWESMYRAQQDYVMNSLDGSLQIYCAVLWIDVEIIQRHNPPLCRPENIIVLNRSTHTEYPNLSPPIHYPFLQDILQVPTDFDYLIYTNSDIALIRYFYTLIGHVIRHQHFDAFVVNRRTIPLEYNNETLHSGHIPMIEKEIIKAGREHPGTDCFVIRKEIIQGIQLGNMFLGHPPWAKMFKLILMNHMTLAFHEFKSNMGWTYHLGDDRDWKKAKNVRNLTLPEKTRVEQCPFFHRPPNNLYTDHWLQNTVNCAEVSSGFIQSVLCLGPPPPFVRPRSARRYQSVTLIKRHYVSVTGGVQVPPNFTCATKRHRKKIGGH
jgi:hypothetical protein